VLADDRQYNHYRSEVLKFLYERQKQPGEDDAQPLTEKADAIKPAQTAELRVVSG
jgi:nitrate/nitrite transport system ATP-binding protein